MLRRKHHRRAPKPEGVDQIGVPAASMGTGVDGDTHYYTDRRFPHFLFRVRWQHDGLWLDRHTATGWVDDDGLLDYFLGHEPGATEITQNQAQQLANSRTRRGT